MTPKSPLCFHCTRDIYVLKYVQIPGRRFVGNICEYSELARIARTSGTLIYVIEWCRQNLKGGYKSKKATIASISKSSYILLVSPWALYICCCLAQVRDASRCLGTTSASHSASYRSYAVNDKFPTYAIKPIYLKIKWRLAVWRPITCYRYSQRN